MSRVDLKRILPEVVLYVINVYEPCQKSVIVKMALEAGSIAKHHEHVFSGKLDQVLSSLLNHQLITEVRGGEFVATYKGVQLLTKQRLAFPRDKYRLYFLKEAMKGRGQ